jgi:hypothetical protein
MSVTALNSQFGFGLQTAKGTPLSAHADLHWMLSTRSTFGPAELVQSTGMEMGGNLFIRDMLKSGVSVAGSFDIAPRPEGLGWLMYALLGDIAEEATPPTGTYQATLTPDSNGDIPWLTVWRQVSGDQFGEIGEDCRIAGLRLSIGAGGIVGASVGLVGITPKITASGNQAWSTAPETAKPFVAYGSGVTQIAGSTVKAQSIELAFTNAMAPQQEMVIGSPFPDDLTVLSRALSVTYVAKLKTELYDLVKDMLYTDSAEAGTQAWNGALYQSSLQVKIVTPDNISGSDPLQPSSLDVTVGNVAWSMEPITLTGGDFVVCRFTGATTVPDSGDIISALMTVDDSIDYVTP